MLTCLTFILIKTILYFPMMQIFLSFLFCRANSPFFKEFNKSCYQGNHLFFTIGSIFGIILLIIQMVYFNYSLVESNPFSKKNLGMSENNTANFDLALMILTPLSSILLGYDVKNIFNGFLDCFEIFHFFDDNFERNLNFHQINQTWRVL